MSDPVEPEKNEEELRDQLKRLRLPDDGGGSGEKEVPSETLSK